MILVIEKRLKLDNEFGAMTMGCNYIINRKHNILTILHNSDNFDIIHSKEKYSKL